LLAAYTNTDLRAERLFFLFQAMAGDNSPAFINKTIRNALNMANITPEELAKVKSLKG
jgi:hypothetical protein